MEHEERQVRTTAVEELDRSVNSRVDHIIVLGFGHLALQVKEILQSKGYNTHHVCDVALEVDPTGHAPQGSVLENFRKILKDEGIERAKGVYLVDDRDSVNIQLFLAAMSLNKEVQIVLSCFNESISPHLQATYKNLFVASPARIAAPAFVDALYSPLKRHLSYVPAQPADTSHLQKRKSLSDHLFWWLGLGFLALILGGATFFHFSEHLSFLDSLYFVTVTITTVGYGDINLQHSEWYAKAFGIVLMLSASVFMTITFALIVDRMQKRREQIALGRKLYKLKDHVILCGLGRVGYHIALELLKRGEKLLIIEERADAPLLNFFREHGAAVFVGDASLSKNLHDADVKDAAALISAINDDLKNLEIGLNARSLKPDLRLILRIFDNKMAEEIHNRLDIHLALSTSAIAAGEFVARIEPATIDAKTSS